MLNVRSNRGPVLHRLYNAGLKNRQAAGKQRKAEMLMRQMRHRYGALPETAVATVLAATAG